MSDFSKVAESLDSAGRIFVMTGAGISAESGVPTFRDRSGLWRKYDPMRLATSESFEADPVLVWEWYLWRRSLIGKARPNLAHEILAAWESRFSAFLIATQNVDRLHQRAGSRKVEELHGDIWRTRGFETGRIYDEGEVEIDEKKLPPRTPSGELIRPNVVWFGETLPREPICAVTRFIEEKTPELCLVIGTSSLFYYIQNWARICQARGALLVEVNPGETPLSSAADVSLRYSAVYALKKLDDIIST